MSVSNDEVRNVASLARLGLEPDRVALLAQELNGILAHIDVLASVDTTAIDLHAHVGDRGMPLRADDSSSVTLQRPREMMAPVMRDGFFLVPRLATHEEGTEAS